MSHWNWKEGSPFISDLDSGLDSPAVLHPATVATTAVPYDSPLGRCTRENCKYLHPPPHLKTQLEINGRNTLATQKMLQNLQNQQLGQVVGLPPNMNLQLQPSQSALLAGSQGVPTAPGQSTPVVIPTSQYHHIPSKDSAQHSAATVAAANAAAASLYQQHVAPAQMTYNGLQIMTQPPYHTLPGVPVTAGQGQPQVHTSQASTDISAMYGGYHFLPVAVSMNSDSRCSYGGYPYSPYSVSMAPSMQPGTHSSANPYGSYFMPFPGHGGNPAAMGQMLDMQALQSGVIPGPGGQGIMLPSMKPKNDKLELPTTSDSLSLKRQRDPSDDALLLAPPPSKKSITGGMQGPQGSAPMMNFLPHTQFPYPSHLNHHMLPSAHQPTPVVPTPFPVMPSIAPGMPGQGIPLFGHQHMMPAQVHTHRPQSNETIPVCRDFKSGSCKRPSCKYAHVTEDYVEIIDGKVTLCRYAVQNRCTRQRCKFYHPPPATTHLTMLPPTVSLPALSAQGISSV